MSNPKNTADSADPATMKQMKAPMIHPSRAMRVNQKDRRSQRSSKKRLNHAMTKTTVNQ